MNTHTHTHIHVWRELCEMFHFSSNYCQCHLSVQYWSIWIISIFRHH